MSGWAHMIWLVFHKHHVSEFPQKQRKFRSWDFVKLSTSFSEIFFSFNERTFRFDLDNFLWNPLALEHNILLYSPKLWRPCCSLASWISPFTNFRIKLLKLICQSSCLIHSLSYFNRVKFNVTILFEDLLEVIDLLIG